MELKLTLLKQAVVNKFNIYDELLDWSMNLTRKRWLQHPDLVYSLQKYRGLRLNFMEKIPDLLNSLKMF